MNDLDRLDRDRIGVLTGALMLALALGRFLEAVAEPIALPRLGDAAPLLPWLLALVIAGLTVSGTLAMIRNHPRHRDRTPERAVENSAMYCLLPTALAMSLWLNLRSLVDPVQWLFALVAAGILLALTLALEYQSVSPRARATASWQWGMLAVHHLAILLLCLAIVRWPTIALVQGLATFVAAWFLSARLLWGIKSDLPDAFLHGGVAGVIMAQAAWAMMLWPLTPWRAALLLLIVYYLVVGLLMQQRQGRLTRRIALEYGGVALMAALLLGLWPG